MKKFATFCLAMALPCTAFAGEPSVPVMPQGYAFDEPEVLADQRLWGIAHGVRLLALACAHAGKGVAAEAWVDWQEREAATIENLRVRLGQYYFQQADAPLDAITAALGLPASRGLSPDVLLPACDTLTEALAQPRYNLLMRREELLKNEAAALRPRQ